MKNINIVKNCQIIVKSVRKYMKTVNIILSSRSYKKCSTFECLGFKKSKQFHQKILYQNSMFYLITVTETLKNLCWC